MQHKVNKSIYYRFFKRFFDFSLALGALILLSPVFIVVWILVRVKLGSPVLFKQKRPGKDEKIFTMYKFRSMSNEKDETGEYLPDYIRLTTFGKFLRKSSLDELPELFNIIKGEMSLVGPRPLALDYLPYYRENERLRHAVLPGLTGLAQIKGRNFLSWEDRFAYDVFYVKNMSLGLDLKILFETFFQVAKSKDSGVRGVDYSENSLDIVRGEEFGTDFSSHQNEIGSEFWLEADPVAVEFKLNGNSLIGEDRFLNFSGRGSLTLILKSIETQVRAKVVLLPGYICESVVLPFLNEGYECLFYDVNLDLEPDLESVKAGLNKRPGIFLHLGYFGFETNSSLKPIIQDISQSGVLIIEDVTHTLLTRKTLSGENDFEFGSYRKWAGMLSGAFAWPEEKMDDITLAENAAFLKHRKEAMELKGRYMRTGRNELKAQYLERFQKSREIIDKNTNAYAIDELSVQIIEQLDVQKMASKRRENFQVLLKSLSDNATVTPVFSSLPSQVVPLFFPLFVNGNRDHLRVYLKDRDIYCPVHWPKSQYIDELSNSRAIFDSILSIPCDQRYGAGDMERVVNLILDYRA